MDKEVKPILDNFIKVYADFAGTNEPSLVCSCAVGKTVRIFTLTENSIICVNRTMEATKETSKPKLSENKEIGINLFDVSPELVFSMTLPPNIIIRPIMLRVNCDGTKLILLTYYGFYIFNVNYSEKLMPYYLNPEEASLERTDAIKDIQFFPSNPNFFLIASENGIIKIFDATNEITKKAEIHICEVDSKTKYERINSIRFGSVLECSENGETSPWAKHALFVLTKGNDGKYQRIIKLCPILLPGDKITDEMLQKVKDVKELRILTTLKKIGCVTSVIIPTAVEVLNNGKIMESEDKKVYNFESFTVSGSTIFIAYINEDNKHYGAPFTYEVLPNITGYNENGIKSKACDVIVEFDKKPNLISAPYVCNVTKERVDRIWTSSNKLDKYANTILSSDGILGFSYGIALIKGGYVIETSPYKYGLTRIHPRYKEQKSGLFSGEQIMHDQNDFCEKIYEYKNSVKEKYNEIKANGERYKTEEDKCLEKANQIKYFCDHYEEYKRLLEEAEATKKELNKLRRRLLAPPENETKKTETDARN